MSANSTVPAPGTLPNPYTPLAWLAPDVATQFEVSQFVYVASFSIFCWDWLTAMPQEFQLLFRHPFAVSTLAYMVARLGTAGFLITSVVFQIAPVRDCNALVQGLGVCWAVGTTVTSLLFLLRARAIFHSERLVFAFFAVFWLAILGTSILVPTGTGGAHIGTTDRCINSFVGKFNITPVILNMAFNLLVFIAISYRLISPTGQASSRLKSFVKADGTSRVASMLIKSGQLYYFVTVGLNVLVVVVVFLDGVPPVLRAMLTVPNLALENIMAGRVFRQLKFSHESGVSNSSGSGAPSMPSAARIAFPRRDDPEIGYGLSVLRSMPNVDVAVTVSRHVDIADDSYLDMQKEEVDV